MGLMERFADPTTFESLSFGEKMAGAGVTTVMGMGITFCVLFLLWFLIAFMTKIIRSTGIGGGKKEKKADKAAKNAPAQATTTAPAASNNVAAAATDDASLIAVIMAAIAASEGAAAVSNLVVRKIRRTSGVMNTWSATGLNEILDSRRV